MGDSSATEVFDVWLFDRLKKLNTDETVFGPYIKSIVDGDEDDAEIEEGLDGLLLELVPEGEVPTLRDEILQRSAAYKRLATSSNGVAGQLDSTMKDLGRSSSSTSGLSVVGAHNGNDLTNQMDTFLRLSGLDGREPGDQSGSSADTNSATKTKASSGPGAVDSELRAAILSHCCVNDSDSEEGDEPQASSGVKLIKHAESLPKNANVEKVLAEQREAKEKTRAEHAKKKEKDKEDRAKQKKSAEDRKEKAKKKAQKTERKR